MSIPRPRRQRGHNSQVRVVDARRGPPVGSGIDVPSQREALAAIGQLSDPGDWESVRQLVMPMFQRATDRPRPEEGELVVVEMPPGVTVAFGLDLGGIATARVSKKLLSSWRRDVGTLVSTAMRNLNRRATLVTPDYVIHERVEGCILGALQTDALWASSLLLLPQQLERIFGHQQQTFTAPMRTLLMSFPAGTSDATVASFTQEFESLDPSALRLESFVLRDGELKIEPLRRQELQARGAQTS